ncbi:hypothetical protein CCR97_26785 [Rhodoplanes elegans]|uniref:Methyltransferase n=1 Tax=Rhodoplanes elegans TaxID=29408 RepID=A0A327KQP9_9BRAD|nr:hypothetical protein [Rhodoplanes elegans]MBK5961786.1 hypothetical protein [Rhodoplanes elegans]RAI40274.1 hypothetical protein CH338_06755 [Rhodoplanes elegans]
MNAQELLQEISAYCRETGLAESTFGRRAVNDGKLAARLRNGGRITTETLDRIRSFMQANRVPPELRSSLLLRGHGVMRSNGLAARTPLPPRAVPSEASPQRHFRFFDNRQKYLLFVHTCSEKRVVAQRVALELAGLSPRPPAVRVFDAGVGDGTVLARVMRAMHDRFPTMPFGIVGKEISLEDVRLTLQKMPDRFFEHPAQVLVLTNLAYADAPWLGGRSPGLDSRLVWHELALSGASAHRFEEQIGGLEPFLAENWNATIDPRTGSPSFDRPVVLVIYREDHRFLLDQVIPRRGAAIADYDLVIASQPYRARAPLAFKARRVIAPLARALAPGGRLVAVHSYGHDPGQEIVQRVWPGDDPFVHDRHDILRAVKEELGADGRDLVFNAFADNRALFRYDMDALPGELADTIGTSTLFAAWNAAVYVAQVEDDRLAAAVADGRYLDATREVLQQHGGLWFHDESYVISRRRQ